MKILCHAEGELRSIDKDEPFVFEDKKGNRRHNQARYEALGEVSGSVKIGGVKERG